MGATNLDNDRLKAQIGMRDDGALDAAARVRVVAHVRVVGVRIFLLVLCNLRLKPRSGMRDCACTRAPWAGEAARNMDDLHAERDEPPTPQQIQT